MKKLLEKKYINSGFVAALLILLIVNIVMYLNISFHYEDEKIITQTLRISQISEFLLSRITEASASRRGYFITSSPEFINEYKTALNLADSVYKELVIMTKDNPNEHQLMDSLGMLIHDRKDLMGEAFAMHKKSKDLNTQIEYTKKGEETQDKIERLIQRIHSEEKSVLNKRLAEAEQSAKYTTTSLVAGNVIDFSLLILAVVLLNRNISRRKYIENTLEESRNWLATTLESIGDGVIVTGKIGEILFMNKVAEQITEWRSVDAQELLLDHVFT